MRIIGGGLPECAGPVPITASATTFPSFRLSQARVVPPSQKRAHSVVCANPSPTPARKQSRRQRVILAFLRHPSREPPVVTHEGCETFNHRCFHRWSLSRRGETLGWGAMRRSLSSEG